MLNERLRIVNPLGLHARAAAQLVRLASSFKSRTKLIRADNDVVADAKSILSVLTLAAAKGIELTIQVDGPDEDAALAAIRDVFANGFGEM